MSGFARGEDALISHNMPQKSLDTARQSVQYARMTTRKAVLILRYMDALRLPMEFELTMKAPVVIGRVATADIALPGENVSRRHCEIRYWAGDYVIKDLHSRNGTRVNGERVAVAVLRLNDVIEVGSFSIYVHSRLFGKSGDTQTKEIAKEMEEGKGYRTILREIVDDVEEKAADND